MPWQPSGGLMPKFNGTIGILTSETGRFSRFWLRLAALQIPPQTKLIAKMSLDIAATRDEVLKDADSEWVWFIDDDHTFEPDLLLRLLARNVDVVQPLVLGRVSPFAPVMMGGMTPDEKSQYRLGLADEEGPRLKECGAVGAAGMLIRRRVWEKIGFPYFNRREGDPDISEDIAFCRRAIAKGFRVWTDMENWMGHLNVGEVWPFYDPTHKTWSTRLHFAGHDVFLPKAQATARIVDGKYIPYDLDSDPPGA